MLYDRPVRELLVDAVAAFNDVFDRRSVIDWFRQHYPAVKSSTVSAHLIAATVNSRSRHHYTAASQYLLYQRPDGLLERYSAVRHGEWDEFGFPVGDHEAQLVVVPPVVPQSGRTFELRAAEVMSDYFGRPLRSVVLEVAPGVPHQFDLVSDDRTVVGDAKWFKNIKTPAAKWSVIAEYVWLLQHLEATERFIVFGQDREVPERWLKRFRPLVAPVRFLFLTADGDVEAL